MALGPADLTHLHPPPVSPRPQVERHTSRGSRTPNSNTAQTGHRGLPAFPTRSGHALSASSSTVAVHGRPARGFAKRSPPANRHSIPGLGRPAIAGTGHRLSNDHPGLSIGGPVFPATADFNCLAIARPGPAIRTGISGPAGSRPIPATAGSGAHPAYRHFSPAIVRARRSTSADRVVAARGPRRAGPAANAADHHSRPRAVDYTLSNPLGSNPDNGPTTTTSVGRTAATSRG